MHLVNFNKVRVKKYPSGYVVEMELKKWYGKTYWRHIISVSGMKDEPWYFKSKESAIESALVKFKFDLIYYSKHQKHE